MEIDYKNLADFKEVINTTESIAELADFKTAKQEKNYNHKFAQITHEENFKEFLKAHPSDQASLIDRCLLNNHLNFVNLSLLYIHQMFLVFLSERGLVKILELLGDEDFAEFLIKLDSDDAIYVLENLEIETRLHIISHCPHKYKIIYDKILSYPQNSVGRVMDTDVITVANNFTARQAVEAIRQAHNNEGLREDMSDIVVIDEYRNFYGTITLANLIRLHEDDKISKYIDKSTKTLDPKQTQKEAANLFAEYENKTIPVVAKNGKVLGIVEDFSIIEYLRNETEDVMLKSHGVFKKSKSLYTSVFEAAKSRSLWLFINLWTAILSSFFISFFESSISQLAPLAVLMPIVASIGGNTGMQTSTVIVRFIATGDIKGMYLRYLKHEIFIGLINAFLFGVISFIVAVVWYHNVALAVCFSISIVFAIIVAVCFGFAIPSVLNKIKIDPAIASSVFLTTVTDIVGFSGFLFLSKTFVL